MPTTTPQTPDTAAAAARFDVDALAFLDRGDAMDALVACSNTPGCEGAVLLFCLPEEAEFQEATYEQVEDEDRYIWQIVDAGDNTVLVPKAVWDDVGDPDDLDAPAPAGHVWIVP